jgi:hypothetical protein
MWAPFHHLSLSILSQALVLACILDPYHVSICGRRAFLKYDLISGSAIIFLSGQKRYVEVSPLSSAIVDTIRTTTIAFENSKLSELARAEWTERHSFSQQERYTDSYVGEVQRGVKSCKGKNYPHS